MRKIVLVIFLLFSLASCNEEKVFSKIHNSKSYVAVDNISSLKEYDNSKIEICGKFHMDFENTYLEKDGEKIWLNFDFYKHLKSNVNENLDGIVLEKFNGEEVKIRGTLNIGKNGHLGLYNSELNEIVYLEN